MWLIRFLRFWRGTIEFQIEGKYLERFLNLAARARIPIWDGKREDTVFTGKTLIRKEAQLREIAEKVQIQWQEKSRFGAPKLRLRYGKRVGMVAGAAVLAFLLLFSEQFVWKIEVLGNEEVTDQQVIETAEQLGLKPGVLKNRLDVIRIADQITVQLEQVSWAAVNLLGTVAEIEIVERVMPPELLDEESPCNVVAGRAGQIVELEVYDGDRQVKIGDVVHQGQLIASGILEDKNGRTILMHARARAVVEYTQEESIEIPLSSKELVVTGNHQNSYRLLFGDFSIPLSLGKPSGSQFSSEKGLVETGVFQSNEAGEQYFYWVRNKALTLFWVPLPVSLQIQQYIPVQETELSLTEAQAKKLALLKLEEIQRRMENQDIMVVKRELQASVRKNSYVLQASLLCQEEVAQETEIQMELSEEKP